MTNQIKKDLNSIEGVTVLNIWGHDDLELEEISARIKVEGKGILVINNLSKDVFQYPDYVSLSEINGKSFEIFSCRNSIGIGGSLNIGTSGQIGKEINQKFNTPKDVIEYFDIIEEAIDSLPRYPKFKYFNNGKYEQFIGVVEELSEDKDPIFNLIGIENKFEFAKTLEWKNKKCFE